MRAPSGAVVDVTSGEFDLLLAFVARPQRVLTRDQLLDLAKGRSSAAFDRSIDVQISRLRRKIEADPREPAIIKTIRSGGYVFTSQVQAMRRRRDRRAFARLGLAARIGAAIVAAVAAIQVLVTLVFVLNPPNFHPFYSARWLSGAVTIIRNAMSGEAQLTSALGNLQNANSLAVGIGRAPPPRLGPGDPPWPLNRVLATVRNELATRRAPSIEAVGMGPSGEPVPVVPADAFATLPSGPLQLRRGPVAAPDVPDRRRSPRWPLADD